MIFFVSGAMFGFAKIKGYCPWPAKKIGEKKGQLWVNFLESKQTGTVSKKNWTEMTHDSNRKIGLKNIKKVGYKKALEEMVKSVELKGKAGSNVDIDYIVSDEEGVNASAGENEFDANSDEGDDEVICDDDISSDGDEGRDDINGDDDIDGVCNGIDESESVNKEDNVVSNSSKETSNIIAAKTVNTGQAAIRSTLAKKTLQDSQQEVQKNFLEKIIQEKNGFSCRFCKFATSIELRAKTHGMTCGKQKKKVGSRKKTVCPECQEVFIKKGSFYKHYKLQHQTSSYKCSTRLKTYSEGRVIWLT